MAQSKNIRYSSHFAWITLCSIAAVFIWVVTSGIALGPIIVRSDDAPRTDEAFSPLAKSCEYIAYSMDYPFSWIRPQSILDGLPALILIALFWGILLYFLARIILWCARQIASKG
jgi:hypothetical protein